MRDNFKKDIYIASIIPEEQDLDEYGNTINVYEEPKLYRFNVQPISGYAQQREYGQIETQIQRAIINYGREINQTEDYFGLFKVYDLAYLDGVSPKGESSNGKNANYRIKSVRNQNKRIVLDFEKIK